MMAAERFMRFRSRCLLSRKVASFAIPRSLAPRLPLRSSRKAAPAGLLRPRARSARFQPIAVVGETEQPLYAVISRRARLRDAPLVRPAGRKLPMPRPARHIIVVDLQHFRGVLDRHFVRPAEIDEDVVAGSVPARPPFDRIAVLLHPAHAAHDRVEVRHLEGDVIQRRKPGLGEHDGAVLGAVAMQKPQRSVLVDLPEAERLGEKAMAGVEVQGVEIDVAIWRGRSDMSLMSAWS